jgi:hypothetical protein
MLYHRVSDKTTFKKGCAKHNNKVLRHFFKSALNATNFPFGNTRYDDDLIMAIYQGTLTHPSANHEPFVWILCIPLISIIINIYFINMLVIWCKIKPVHIQPIKQPLNQVVSKIFLAFFTKVF